MATIVVLGARDDNLRCDVNIWPLSISGNLYSVRECRGCRLSPAGSAVEGKMLVLEVGEIVGIVNIVPDPLFRKSNVLQRFVDMRALQDFVVLHSAWCIMILSCKCSAEQ
jgi:hypothetical protein